MLNSSVCEKHSGTLVKVFLFEICKKISFKHSQRPHSCGLRQFVAYETFFRSIKRQLINNLVCQRSYKAALRVSSLINLEVENEALGLDRPQIKSQVGR